MCSKNCMLWKNFHTLPNSDPTYFAAQKKRPQEFSRARTRQINYISGNQRGSTYLHAYVKILPSALVLHMVNVTLAPSYYGIQLYIHSRDNDPLPPQRPLAPGRPKEESIEVAIVSQLINLRVSILDTRHFYHQRHHRCSSQDALVLVSGMVAWLGDIFIE